MKMDNILIISDYEGGYAFSTYYNGKHNDKTINTICSLWDDCLPATSFITLRQKLSEIDIYPENIIACSDGAIYIEKE